MQTFQEFINEVTKEIKSLDNVKNTKDEYSGYFTINNIKYSVMIELLDESLGVWIFKFYRINNSLPSVAMMNDYNEVGSIISTIQHTFNEFLLSKSPAYLGFAANLNDKGRIRVYDKRTSRIPGYEKHEFVEGQFKYYILANKSIIQDLTKIREILVRNFIVQ